ncbi:hypothetical protein P4O66_002438 [Electrophorus voltai]|uniref:Non-specific serine/threonine protein kinase n=1 Tax=Electrophorus voltai TaxID=2609070 RepID=A0AAD8YZV1_9TELE|nr:hypothetical protein P4O66_002438 [Electrophorus voltai]
MYKSTLEGGPYPSFSPAIPAEPSPVQPRNPELEQKAKALRGRMFVLNELIQTEKDYVKDLGIVVEGFMKKIEEKGVPEDMKGKDKIVFGNIHQIYDWHRDFFVGELEKCLGEHEKLPELFIKHERRLHMYVVYCQNKPKSEFIVAEYDSYFEDFLKFSSKAGLDCQGIQGKLTSQGKLLQQETFFVTEQDSGVLSRSKERRVFLFEQIVIFSELLRKGSSTPGYQFKKSIKVSYLALEEHVDNDPCKFVLTSRGSAERFTLQAANTDVKQVWVHHITELLDAQSNFLSALQSPIEYQKEKGTSHSLTRNSSSGGRSGQARPSSAALGSPEKAPLSGRASTPLKLPTSNGSPCLEPHKHESSKGCNGVSSSMTVTQDYSALKENEICVMQGEIVQVLATNQQNMYLVYRPANSQSPAAEGWVPGNILGPLSKTITDTAADSNIKKSLSWNTLRARKRAEKEGAGKSEPKLENGSRKPKDILSSKVNVKESHSSEESECEDELDPKTSMELMNPNFIQEEFLIALADVTCALGETVVLCCKVCGRPKPTVTLKGPDQSLLVNNNRFTINIRETGDILLKICNLMPQDTGIYTCVAVNDHGTASSSASIKVQGETPAPSLPYEPAQAYLIQKMGLGSIFTPTSVPAAPVRPVAQEASSMAVVVHWGPPASSGNCAITSYTVEYRQEGNVPNICTTFTSHPHVRSEEWVSLKLPRGSGSLTLMVKAKVLERGRFSVVRKCLQKACKKEVAAKFVNKKMQKKEQVAHEADLLKHVQNPQLVALADTYESPTAYILILELLEGGRLLDYLVAHDELMEEKVAYFIKDTLEALQSLHTCKVAHLDLKPENLMVDLHKPAPCVKLIDFGDAVLISGHRYVHLLLGNPEFAAPELIQGMPVSLSTDVWSVGVLAYVMLSGVSPFLDESLEETCVNVCKLDFCFPDEYFHGVSQAARDFVVSALSLDPRRRPSSSTCLQHPWVGTHSADYSKTPLDTARLASFIDRRKQLHDVRPVTNIKGLVSSSMGHTI